MKIDACQIEALTREHFFGRVATFILQQTTHVEYRCAVSNVPARDELWGHYWPQFVAEPEALAAMYLCFVLACRALGLDPGEGVAIARSAEQPAFSLKTFLATHGLLRFSAFDVPELMREDAY
jgi:hypothetical protein